jgi:hypothetical protein
VGERFLDRRGLLSAAVETLPALLDLDEALFECNYPRRHSRASARGCPAEFASRGRTAPNQGDDGIGSG